MSKKRIGIIPVETAGYVAGLESGLSALGYEVRAVTIGDHVFEYGQLQENPLWARWSVKASKARSQGKSVSSFGLAVASLALRVWGTLWVLVNFDQIVLNDGRSLLPLHLDLVLYRARGIKLVAMMGHGSEIRPACIDSLGDTRTFSARERNIVHRRCFARRRFVRRVECLVHVVISTPTLSHYLQKPYVNGHLLGIPIPRQRFPENQSPLRTRDKQRLVPKVVHIPSQPLVKGSERIVELCRTLEREGLIEFEVKSGLTHFEAIALLGTCDLLIDQAYSDVYMPVLATEAAFLGKPALVAGYAWDFLDRTTSILAKPPVINVGPDEMESILRKLLSDPIRMEMIGRKAKEFVLCQRTADEVARKYEPILSLQDNYISEISEKPALAKYAWGCGSSMESINALAQAGKLHRCF